MTATPRLHTAAVRLVHIAVGAQRSCPTCGDHVIAAGYLAVEVDGAEPCLDCLRSQLGAHAADFIVDVERLLAELLADVPAWSAPPLALRPLLAIANRAFAIELLAAELRSLAAEDG